MKNLLLILGCTGGLSLHAQEVFVGLHGGYTLNNVSWLTIGSTGPGYRAGVNGRYQLNETYALVAEFNYEIKSTEGNDKGLTSLPTDKDRYLSCVSLPVLVRIYTPERRVQAFGEAGFYYGFLSKAWISSRNGGEDEDVTATFRRSDFGFTAGVGVSCRLSSLYSLQAGWRYNMGLVNVSKVDNRVYYTSNLFHLGLVYRIG